MKHSSAIFIFIFIPQITGGTNLFDLLEFKYELAATEADFQLMKRILELNPGKKLANLNPEKYCKDDLVPHQSSIASANQIATCMETQGILLQLFSRFIKIEDQRESSLNPNSKIKQAIDYIRMNLSKPISITELAGICSLSNDYFSRLFLKNNGNAAYCLHQPQEN